MAFTLTPAYAHSTAAVSVKFNIPARAAPECPIIGIPIHMSAMTFTMAPPFASID